MSRKEELLFKGLPLFLGVVVSFFTINKIFQVPSKFGWDMYVYIALIVLMLIQLICVRITEICNIYYLWVKNKQHKKAMKAYINYVKDPEVVDALRKIYATKDWDYSENSFSDSILTIRPSDVQFDFRLRQILTKNIYLNILEGKESLTKKLEDMFVGTNLSENLVNLNKLPARSKSNYIRVERRNTHTSLKDYVYEDSDDVENYYKVKTIVDSVDDGERKPIFKGRWFENYFEPFVSVDKPQTVVMFKSFYATVGITAIMLFINPPRTLLFAFLFVSMVGCIILNFVVNEFVSNVYRVDFNNEDWRIK